MGGSNDPHPEEVESLSRVFNRESIYGKVAAMTLVAQVTGAVSRIDGTARTALQNRTPIILTARALRRVALTIFNQYTSTALSTENQTPF